VEVKELARRLLDDPDYLERLRQRLHRGTAGAIEQTLFFYANGMPRDVIEQQGELVIRCEVPSD
jgi:hypothetical protein